MHKLQLLPLLGICTLLACSREAPPADAAAAVTRSEATAIVNAKVWTGDESQPWADALLIEGAQIERVGSLQQIQAAGAGHTIDAGGRLVVPGFIDSHMHFVEGGFRLASVQLRDAKTREEFAARIRAFAATVPAGTWISGGDWFVAPPTPLEGIYAAATRRTLDDKNPAGWVPEQKIGIEEALRAYTSGAAFASFEESRKGTLAPGRLADIVMLDRDIFTIPPEDIRNVKVTFTMVGGKVVYGAPPTAAEHDDSSD